MRGDDYLESERVNNLSPPAEIFYFRLLCAVDAHGKLDARPAILRTKLYALQLDKKREADLPRLLHECEQAGLVRSYQVSGKPYLIVPNFRQRLRAASKYPDPPPVPTHDRHMTDTCLTHDRHMSDTYPHEEEYEIEEEKEDERECEYTTHATIAQPQTQRTHTLSRNEYLNWITAIKDAHPAGREQKSFVGNNKLRQAARDAFARMPHAVDHADLLRAFYDSSITVSSKTSRPFHRPSELLYYFCDLADVLAAAKQWAREMKWKPTPSQSKHGTLVPTSPQPPPQDLATDEDIADFCSELREMASTTKTPTDYIPE